MSVPTRKTSQFVTFLYSKTKIARITLFATPGSVDAAHGGHAMPPAAVSCHGMKAAFGRAMRLWFSVLRSTGRLVQRWRPVHSTAMRRAWNRSAATVHPAASDASSARKSRASQPCCCRSSAPTIRRTGHCPVVLDGCSCIGLRRHAVTERGRCRERCQCQFEPVSRAGAGLVALQR